MAQSPVTAEFLRVPPFPGAKPPVLARLSARSTIISDDALDQLLARIAELKVGGIYWGSQPALPDPGYTVLRLPKRQARKHVGEIAGKILELPQDSDADPWHMLSRAGAVVADANDEFVLLAAIAGVPVKCIGQGRFSGVQAGKHPAIREAFRAVAVEGTAYRNPFSGEEIDLNGAAELCGFWRQIIDSNRDWTAALGFAFWKRRTVAPLLWDGKSGVPFASARASFKPGDRVAVWKSRTQRRSLARLEMSGAGIAEVEDGFIRSTGLGADCVPPLSIVVDSRGIYFDPKRPSDLEHLLQQGHIAPEILSRARHLRQLIVNLGISKYGAGAPKLERRSIKRHLLVVGQVEDDRAVLEGLGPSSNAELLRRVREGNLDTHIIYKPHPDVEAGHRAGAIPDAVCLQLADEIVRNVSISSLIDLVDEVHVNTSLAGFEALLRGKAVITYGVPFYAGWGLTSDHGPIPNRRNTKRNIDELVAAALLLYPRYLDPITGLPCPPEILVRRIAEESSDAKPTQLVRLRRLQGKWKRSLAALRSNR
jgi:capsular polysaccharide export protein